MRFTTLSCFCLACAVSGASGQSLINTNRTLKPLTEDECIRLALEHNIDIQIKRLDPNIDRYKLAASYGIYDPVFNARYRKDSNSREGSFDPTTGVNTRDSTSDSDTVGAGLGGYLPTGLAYDMSGNLSHNRGEQGIANSFNEYVSGVGINLSQPLLRNFWIDSRRANIQIAKMNQKVSQYNLDSQIRNVLRDVRLSYFEVGRAREEVKVQQKALELANALVAQNREKVRVGTLAPLDEKQAESQAATTLADLLEAERVLITAENKLKSLMTDNYEAWLNVAIDPADKLVAVPEKLSLSQSLSDAVSKRPDLQAAKVAIETRGITVKLLHNQLFPALNLTGSYGYSGLDSSRQAFGSIPSYDASVAGSLGDISDQNHPSWSFGTLLSVPLSRKAERNNYKAEKETYKQTELLAKKLQQDIVVSVDDAMTQVFAAYQRVGATREARVYAEAALDAEQKKLDNGKSTSFQVLQFQKDLTTARSAELSALASYNKFLAELQHRDGTSLERKQISIQYK